MRNSYRHNNGWLRSVKTLVPMINVLHSFPSDQNVKKFYDLVSIPLNNRGEDDAIARLKAYRVALQQYVLGQTIEPIPFCKTDRDGFPKAISFLKPDLNDVNSIRYSFSLMRIIESFKCEPKYSVHTIVDASTADENLIEEISDYIRNWSFLKHKMPKLGTSQLVMSNKAGPNGPATISALKDLQALRLHDPKLLKNINALMGLTNPGIDTWDYKTPESGGEKLVTSKLVCLSDNACKTRVIAIADWWSNTALEALHRAFMKGLRRLPGDVTYRQSDIPKLVKGFGLHLFGSDITAFTDRFPRKLEVVTVETAYGAKISKLWNSVIADRIFSHPKGDVKYETGNPMGLLSSWAVSTMTHHAVKRYCVHKVKLNVRKYKYLILGDDTIDTNELVYNKYCEVISRLGVSLSPAKCTQSKQGKTEFAKRYFIRGVEVTGMPVNLLKDVRNKPEQALELVRILRERGYEDSFLVPSVSLFLKSHKKGKQIADMLSLPQWVTGTAPLLEVVPGSHAEKLMAFEEEDQSTVLTLARNYVFWDTTSRINKPRLPQKVSQEFVEENHPLLFGLSSKLAAYMPEDEEDEFSIYNAWMNGDYRQMAVIPTVDAYRYYNKGHYATKCKFDVLNATLGLANGNTRFSMHKPTKLSNFELFSLGYQVAELESDEN